MPHAKAKAGSAQNIQCRSLEPASDGRTFACTPKGGAASAAVNLRLPDSGYQMASHHYWDRGPYQLVPGGQHHLPGCSGKEKPNPGPRAEVVLQMANCRTKVSSDSDEGIQRHG